MPNLGAMAALRKMAQRLGPGGAPLAENPMTGGIAAAGAGAAGIAAAAQQMQAQRAGGGNLPPGGQIAPGQSPLQAPDGPIPPGPPGAPGQLGDEDGVRAERLLREAQLVGDASPETLMKLAEELFAYLPPPARMQIVQRAAMLGQASSAAPMQQPPQAAPGQ
jgi:hypothetical protein